MKKKVIFVHGDKGGVGKTEAAKRTVSAMLAAGKEVTLIDGDATTSGLYTAFDTEQRPVHRCDVLTPSGVEHMYQIIAEADPGIDIIIDLPATASSVTKQMTSSGSSEGEIDIHELMDEIDAKLWVMFVINDSAESVAALRDELGALARDTSWIVVKNHYDRRTFDTFESSKTKKSLLDAGGKILDLQRLDPRVNEQLRKEKANLASIGETDLNHIMKIRARSALRSWTEELRKVGVLDDV